MLLYEATFFESYFRRFQGFQGLIACGLIPHEQEETHG